MSANTTSQAEVQPHQGGKYTWVTAPDVPWDWNECVWVEHLYHCLKEASSLSHFQIVPAFHWRPKEYLTEVATLFRNVTTLPVSPFQGMTDMLICSKSNIALLCPTNLEECVCCVEVGTLKEATYPLAVGTTQKRWLQKIWGAPCKYALLWYPSLLESTHQPPY